MKFMIKTDANSFKDENNNILIEVINEKNIDLLKVAIYARVSSNKNRANLDTQVTRLKAGAWATYRYTCNFST